MGQLLIIKRRADFLAARRGRTSRTSGFLLVRHERGDDGPARVGFTVTKKMGGAVTRNRMKRRLREAIRAHFEERAIPGSDYIVIAHRGALSLPFKRLLDDMAQALLTLSKTPR